MTINNSNKVGCLPIDFTFNFQRTTNACVHQLKHMYSQKYQQKLNALNEIQGGDTQGVQLLFLHK